MSANNPTGPAWERFRANPYPDDIAESAYAAGREDGRAEALEEAARMLEDIAANFERQAASEKHADDSWRDSMRIEADITSGCATRVRALVKR